MKTSARLNASDRVVPLRERRRTTDLLRGQRRKVSGEPQRMATKVEANPGKVVVRGNSKIWSGTVPTTPLDQAVELTRHYER